MKNISFFYILALVFFTISCEGEFDAFGDDGEVRLLSPENQQICPNGEILNGAEIQIPLEWSSGTDFSTYEIVLTDKDGNSLETISTTELSASVNVQRGELYNWTVTGVRGGERIKSKPWSFYSEGNATSNHAPYPAEISHTSSNGSVTLTWSATDEDNDIENYDVFLSTTNPTTTLLLEKTSETQTTTDLVTGVRYYVRIIAFDTAGNYAVAKYDFVP